MAMAESTRCTAAAAQLKQAGRYHMLDTDGGNRHNGQEGGGEVAAVEGGVGQGLCFMARFPAPFFMLLYLFLSSPLSSGGVGQGLFHGALPCAR